MNSLLRRLRGLLGVGLVTGTAWAALGMVIVAIGRVFDPASVDPGEGPLIAALVMGRAGFVAGLIAGGVLAIAERRRRVGELSVGRGMVWGALAGLSLPWLAAAPVAMMPILAALGAVTIGSVVAIARRGESRSLPGHPTGHHELP